MAKQDDNTVFFGTQKDAMSSYVCDGRSHTAVECSSKASTSQNEPFGRGRRFYCFKCGAMAHEAYDCMTALQQPQPGSKARWSSGGNPTQRVACAFQESRKRNKEEGFWMETLELKSGEKIKVPWDEER